MAAAAPMENEPVNAPEEPRKLLACGCGHTIGAGGDYFCAHVALQQRSPVVRYSRDEIMELNTNNGEPRSGVIVNEEVFAFLASTIRERVDSYSSERDDSGYGSGSLADSISEEGENPVQDGAPVSISELFNQPLSVRPVAVPVRSGNGQIPILPMCFFENVLNHRVDGDGFDIFRAPFPAELVRVSDEAEDLLQFKASPEPISASTSNSGRQRGGSSRNVARRTLRVAKQLNDKKALSAMERKGNGGS
ncbi:hypothetical protein QR680_017861 [Steinernema hermaphroditum]|uniref:Uncharacterized protein n=1 Tax=Steinernema hermaphroditum TaxID=289476 RepID=A0AA39HG35_9BILA|nr:hypothetical protein QR680_017861 [Steinernema hermaphroditum]